MDIDKLKESMASLDEVLAAKAGNELNFDVQKCTTAQKRIYGDCRRSLIVSLVMIVFFLTCWSFDMNMDMITMPIRIYLIALLALGGVVWNFVQMRSVMRIDVISSTPVQVLKSVSLFKFRTVVGEFVMCIALTVFFTLLFSELLAFSSRKFWITAGLSALCIGTSIAYFLPRTLRNFRNLTAVSGE